jgi:hypothetical protein
MTTILHIPEHASVAHLEGLLMRFPCSIRLKRKLDIAKRQEAREARKARSAVIKRLRAGLKVADLATLKSLVAELEQKGIAG